MTQHQINAYVTADVTPLVRVPLSLPCPCPALKGQTPSLRPPAEPVARGRTNPRPGADRPELTGARPAGGRAR